MDRRLILALTATVSAAAGAFVGFKVAAKRAGGNFDRLLEEEIEKTKQHYQRVNKAGNFSTPEAAAEKLVGEAATALVGNGTRVITDVSVRDISVVKEANPSLEAAGLPSAPVEVAPPEEDEVHNVWAEPAEAYPITAEDFLVNDTAYEQLSVDYYELDSVVAEHDKPLADVDRCVGIGNLATFGDEDIIYVRNDRLKTDYEITKSTGSFAKEVLGLGDDGLQHSDEPFPRKRRLRDD